ncbi:MAG: glycine cleavage system protein H [Bryobacteraceae bacterium]
MTVLLVLFTFGAFILIDWILSRKKIAAAEQQPEAAESLQWNPDYVEGFLVPDRFQYHPGHSWVLKERKKVARVGVDEFAAALLGRIEKIELPKPGTWLRQGQKAFSFYRNGEKTEVLSPTEGEVVEVNEEVLRDPSVLRKDPYGSGWLLMVHVPDEETVSRNLVPTSMIRSWMRDAVERLYSLQPHLAGAVAADGGRPVDDLLAGVPNASWRDLTADFFLSK